MPRSIFHLTLFLLLTALVATASADVLEDRADDHNAWANTYNIQPVGGIGYVYFTEPGSFDIDHYSLGDSTIWTGTYLASEAFRYAVTGDQDAKDNAIRTVHALDAHLKITGVPGFIARCAAPDVAPYNTAYTSHDRYVQGVGEWEGYFWINNTSRDQYSGWFFGMTLAYDLIDDEPTRELIRDDIAAVIANLTENNWWIIGENGSPTDAGPQVLSGFRLAWLAAAARILDTPELHEMYEDLYAADQTFFALSNFSWLNKYYQYYGFNLSHLNFFTLWRNETNPERRAFYLDAFHKMIWPHVKHTHNVFFDGIYLANCERAGECRDTAETMADVQVQLFDFQDPPVAEVPKEIPEWELDPFAVFMSDLIDQLGIRDLLDIRYQTADPRTVAYRCPRSFMWQKSPYNLDCPGGDGTEVYPGVDYMLSYWMGRYYDLIDPGNTNDVFWPADDPIGDDDDDDDDDNDDDDNDDDNDDDDTPVDDDDDDDDNDNDDDSIADDDDAVPADDDDDDDNGGCGG
jgi:hypothetical protein